MKPELIRPNPPEQKFGSFEGKYGPVIKTNAGSFYSVTTILRMTRPPETTRRILNAGHRSVETYGKEQAKAYSDQDSTRGTEVHGALKQYFEDWKLPLNLESQYQEFGEALQPIIAGVSPQDLLGVEEYVCHDRHGYASRLDFRALWGGVHTVFELRTSFRSLPEDWLLDKILQAIACAIAVEYMYEQKVPRVVLINTFSTPPASPKRIPHGLNCFLVEGEKMDYYRQEWMKRLEQFKRMDINLLPTPAQFF